MLVDDRSPVLPERLGPEATVGTRRLLATAGQEERDDALNVAVARFERRLTDESAGLRLDIAGVRQEISAQGALLRREFSDQRFELLKWTFAFWVGQALATLTLIGVLLAR